MQEQSQGMERRMVHRLLMHWRGAQQTDEIPNLDAKKTTLLICNDGSLSIQASKLLEACKFRVYTIRGGIIDWEQIIGM